MKGDNPTRDQQRLKMQADAEALRAAVAAGDTVVGATRRLGLSKFRGKKLAAIFNIKASATVLARAYSQSQTAAVAVKRAKAEARAAAKRAKRKAEREARARIAPPNPRLTAAQNANIARGKNIIRAMYNAMGRGKDLAPISREEADRLVAEHIARHGVTKCPPAMSPEKPINAGLGWGRGR